jgi:predicted membrane protein
MIIEKNIAKLCGFESENIIHNGLVLLAALLLTMGFGMLFSTKRRKRKKHGYTVTYDINKDHGSDDSDDSDGEGKTRHFSAGGSLASHTVYVDCKNFCPSAVENNLGACVVYFENVEEYAGNKTLRIDNNLGAMTINVPSAWHVVTSIDNNLGDVKVPANEAGEGAPALFIEGDNNLGAISIKFV